MRGVAVGAVGCHRPGAAVPLRQPLYRGPLAARAQPASRGKGGARALTALRCRRLPRVDRAVRASAAGADGEVSTSPSLGRIPLPWPTTLAARWWDLNPHAPVGPPRPATSHGNLSYRHILHCPMPGRIDAAKLIAGPTKEADSSQVHSFAGHDARSAYRGQLRAIHRTRSRGARGL